MTAPKTLLTAEELKEIREDAEKVTEFCQLHAHEGHMEMALSKIGIVASEKMVQLSEHIQALEKERGVLAKEHAEMKLGLMLFAECQAEDNFKNWQDKVNDVQTWQEEFLNQVIMKPLNEEAKRILSRITR